MTWRRAARPRSDPVRPSSPYSVAKAAGDLWIPAYARTFGVDALVTRGSNTYGPNQYPEKLIPLFTTNALDGDSRCRSTATDASAATGCTSSDHCAAIELVLREGRAGEIYNVGAGDERENRRDREPDPRADRGFARAPPSRRRPSRPRPALLGRLGEGCGRARLDSPEDVRGRAGGDRRLVSGESALVGAAQVRRRAIATTTAASTGTRLAQGSGRAGAK